MSRLGDFLMQEGLLSLAAKRMVRRESVAHNGSFAKSVLALGIIGEEELGSLLATKTSVRRAAKDILHELDLEVETLVPKPILAWLEVLPLSVKDGVMSLAVLDPTDLSVINQIKFLTNLRVRPVIATRGEILRGLRRIGAELPEMNDNGSISQIGTSDASSSVGTKKDEVSANRDALGISLIRNPSPQSTEFVDNDAKIDESKRQEDLLTASEKVIAGHAAADSSGSKRAHRLESMMTGLGALTEHQLVGKPRTRSGVSEPSVAVQAAMSVLNRSNIKLQSSKTLEDALKTFIEAVKKAGLRNGFLARVKAGFVDLSAHWSDSGLDENSSLGLPNSVDPKLFATVLKKRSDERAWIDVRTAFGPAEEQTLSFWNAALAKPDSVFVIERDDGGLVCAVSFPGQYAHDGLKQIFYDSMRILNSRL